MKKRLHIKQTLSLRDRIECWAETIRERAALLPPGRRREELLKKVRASETASYLDAWVNSRGLQPPK